MHKHLFLLLAIGMTVCMSCDEDDGPTFSLPESGLIENLHAPNDSLDRETGEVLIVRPYVYYQFDGQRVVDGEVDDSWDIALKGTTILVNGGNSGKGQGAAAVMTGLFEEIISAPADSEFATDEPTGLAIPTGSGNGWYAYNPVNHIISPIPGRILVIRTHDGKYAKMEILSYYKDAPADPNAFNDQDGTYTFRFAYQADGSKQFVK